MDTVLDLYMFSRDLRIIKRLSFIVALSKFNNLLNEFVRNWSLNPQLFY